MKAFLAIIVTALLLSGCATSNVDKSASRTESAASSAKNAGVLLRMRGGSARSKIYISSYNPEKLLKGLPVAGSKIFGTSVASLASSSGYAYTRLKPGHYFIRNLTHETYKVGCFYEGTYKFEVKPNQAAFIGDIDMRAAIRNLEEISKGHKPNQINISGVYNNVPRIYFKKIVMPDISHATDEMLSDVK